MVDTMKRITLLLGAAFVLLAPTLTVIRAAAQPGVVTDNNLSQMIKDAKTPSDHEQIAEYYDREAAENQTKAELHRISENMYFKTSNRLHCDRLIKAYQEGADQDKALAAYHRDMAKKAGAQAAQ